MKKKQLPLIPPVMLVNTGEGNKVQKIREEFFDQILSYLGFNEEAAAAFSDIEYRGTILLYSVPPQPLDDEIVMLRVRDQLVASVIHRRDRFNFVQVVFAHYLDPETIKRASWREPVE